ncbi:MAG: hypothetical protein QW582_00515, partial [Candidatus Micrarchaeaceae archaeon]
MNEKQINNFINKIKKEDIKFRDIENKLNITPLEATEIRRKLLEKKFNCSLNNIGIGSIDFADAINRNIENPIGVTQIPLGYAGDLSVNGSNAAGNYPILLATTEGKLIAGVSRGISILNSVSGVSTEVINDGMTRDVLIKASNIKEVNKLIHLLTLTEIRDLISNQFSKSSSHIKLIEAKPIPIGRYLHIRFKAFTGAAMGMNMVTIASYTAAKAFIDYVSEKFNINAKILSESGNMCSDKKPAMINVIEGRGVSVIADAFIPNSLLISRFGINSNMIAEVNKAKNLLGSAAAGSNSFNGHVANILAAMYIAYGQDVAQIVEGSQ